MSEWVSEWMNEWMMNQWISEMLDETYGSIYKILNIASNIVYRSLNSNIRKQKQQTELNNNQEWKSGWVNKMGVCRGQ